MVFIAVLWIFFYAQQKHQQQKHNMSRYFSSVNSLQPLLIQSIPITNENLSVLNMKIYTKKIPSEHKVVFQKGNDMKGFKILQVENKNILHIYNPISEIFLQDTQEQKSMNIIHGVFLLLLIAQILLYTKIKKSLTPLSIMQKKLAKLKTGDLTPLELVSEYDEINQMTASYNNSIERIEYILETREMFNKIFMHEMKTPIAKGMFCVKQEASPTTHEKLEQILKGLNQELDEFSQIENLIEYQSEPDNTQKDILPIINEAIKRLGAEEKVLIKNCQNCVISGDEGLWILCFKNLIDNALKYSQDNHLTIECDKNEVFFINHGKPLPIDLSKDIKKWKLNKNQRHKSSTGYGFGLFIIKTIVSINKYQIDYSFDEKRDLIKIRIF